MKRGRSARCSGAPSLSHWYRSWAPPKQKASQLRVATWVPTSMLGGGSARSSGVTSCVCCAAKTRSSLCFVSRSPFTKATASRCRTALLACGLSKLRASSTDESADGGAHEAQSRSACRDFRSVQAGHAAAAAAGLVPAAVAPGARATSPQGLASPSTSCWTLMMSPGGHSAASGVAASPAEQQYEFSEPPRGRVRAKYQHGLMPNLAE
mmetsp:Transcript_100273/g.284005  ORF Transcript_100273/g.284005 Transcript_100273/m.284005 type:complete len:209 (+) Transcript_100273:1030-1656(+)